MGHRLTLSNGATTAEYYLAVPASGTGRGVLVLHAWWGLTSVFTSVCDRLAEAGFVALAPDLYAGRTATTREQAEQLSSALARRPLC
jgi:carboxymethylenebutenolidase